MIFPSLVTRSGLDFSEFHHHTQNTVDFVKQHCKDHCKVLPTLKGGSCTARANPTHHEEFTAGVSMSRMQLLKIVPYLAFSLNFIPESIFLMHNELWLLDENMTLLAAFMGFFLIYWTRVYPSGDISTSKWGVTSARLSDVYCTPRCCSFPTLCLTGSEIHCIPQAHSTLRVLPWTG